MTQVVGFWAKIRRLGSSDSQIEKITVGFCIFRLHKQGHSFLRSKNTNLKLEIEPHREQPQVYWLLAELSVRFHYSKRLLCDTLVGIRYQYGAPQVRNIR